MLAYLKRVPAWAEIILVVGLTLGYFMFASVESLFGRRDGVMIDKDDLKFLLLYEPLALTAAGLFLWMRGWRARDIGLGVSRQDFVVTPGLMLGTWCVAYIAAMVTNIIFLGTVTKPDIEPVERSLDPALIIVVSIVNGVFEEAIATGYLLTALGRIVTPWTAIHISVGIKLVYHLYQGAAGVVMIVPFALMFGYWFTVNRRLLPLILAHSAFDVLALATHSWL